MLISLFAGFFSNDLAIDLGTANTLVFVRGRRLPGFDAFEAVDLGKVAAKHL